MLYSLYICMFSYVGKGRKKKTRRKGHANQKIIISPQHRTYTFYLLHSWVKLHHRQQFSNFLNYLICRIGTENICSSFFYVFFFMFLMLLRYRNSCETLCKYYLKSLRQAEWRTYFWSILTVFFIHWGSIL